MGRPDGQMEASTWMKSVAMVTWHGADGQMGRCALLGRDAPDEQMDSLV